MADVYVDASTRAAWVPTMANFNLPTVTELNAGILLQKTLTGDGLIGFEADSQLVDNTSLASRAETNGIGKDKFNNTALRLKKQSGVDTVYNTLTPRATGFIVIRRDIDEGVAWTSGQAIEVFEVICGTAKNLPPTSGPRRYEVPVPVTSGNYNLRAAVA